MSDPNITTVTVKAIAEKNGVYSEAAETSFTVQFELNVSSPSYTPESGSDVATTAVLTFNTQRPSETVYYTVGSGVGQPDPTNSNAYDADNEPTFASLASAIEGNYPKTITIKARAARSGYNPSAIQTLTFTVKERAATPTFRLDGAGEDLDSSQTEPFPVTSNRLVTITSSTNGATIYYTTNGDDPGETASTRVTVTPTSPGDPPSATLSFNSLGLGTHTIKAIAVHTDYINSALASMAFTVSSPVGVATPEFIVNDDSVTGDAPVLVVPEDSLTISSDTPGATIYYTYTSDGSTPATIQTIQTMNSPHRQPLTAWD